VAESYESPSPLEAPGVRVSLDQGMQIASLRYFEPNGAFSRTVQATIGMPLPDRLCATCVPERTGAQRAVLAWRSPTETLLLCDEEAPIAQLLIDVATLNDGCVVEQTGGTCVLRMSGERVADLFARMGGQATLPVIGAARRSRLADIPVLALRVKPGEILLIVERPYVEHLMGWIRASAADLQIA
jgi:heterotetrameric sarcosine oxidase gamma subunit